jgi:DNA-binding NarL/FixJ family response regulator
MIVAISLGTIEGILQNKITIVIADDHAIVRQGIRSLLEQEPDFVIVGEAADGVQALDLIERVEPLVLVIDMSMPNLSGIELLRIIKERRFPVRPVVLSMHAEHQYLTGTLESGVYGYVLKEEGVEHLAKAIREAHAGRRYFSPQLLKNRSVVLPPINIHL